MKNAIMVFVVAFALAAYVAGCKKSEEGNSSKDQGTTPTAAKPAPDTHVHDDGSTHTDHGSTGAEEEDHDHAHDEVSLGTAAIGDLEVEFAQGHGKVAAGMEGHLVVKLPYNDNGASIVRAWIGTEDRLKSVVGKGEYAPSHDDYDVHAIAPDPLPANAMWWVEVQKPDGTKLVGSVKPLM
jgi:hypothetical protein